MQESPDALLEDARRRDNKSSLDLIGSLGIVKTSEAHYDLFVYERVQEEYEIIRISENDSKENVYHAIISFLLHLHSHDHDESLAFSCLQSIFDEDEGSLKDILVRERANLS